ncbi:MAG: hypothetical protein IJT58_04315 [Synergistaceae bacterium]|nr:hypothetical protein [Synergistaceae bacterium]
MQQGGGGHLVFTCDQDDIWLPDKIQVMTQAMDDNPQIMLLASNYVPFNDNDGKKIQAHVKYIDRDDGEIIKLRLSDTWLENLRPGCTYCFRSELLDKFDIFDIENSAHDGMLWKYAIISDSLYLINRQLIYYRRHDHTTTGVLKPSKPANLDNRVNGSLGAANFYMKFANAPDELGITKNNRELLTRKANFLVKRGKVLAVKNVFTIILFVFMHIKYYPTMRNALSDIYAALFLK